MALPDPENLAYEGQTSGSGKCAAYMGFICGPILASFQNAVRAVVQITKRLRR